MGLGRYSGGGGGLEEKSGLSQTPHHSYSNKSIANFSISCYIHSHTLTCVHAVCFSWLGVSIIRLVMA